MHRTKVLAGEKKEWMMCKVAVVWIRGKFIIEGGDLMTQTSSMGLAKSKGNQSPRRQDG